MQPQDAGPKLAPLIGIHQLASIASFCLAQNGPADLIIECFVRALR